MTYASYAKLRDARGLKDNDVAHLAGVPQSTFSAWKKGDYKPKEEKRRKIANCLQVSLDELDGIKEMDKNQLFGVQIGTFFGTQKEGKIIEILPSFLVIFRPPIPCDP